MLLREYETQQKDTYKKDTQQNRNEPGIRTWDLSVCLYLNLKHGDLDHSATTAGWLTPCSSYSDF